jgi:hypothetical protein
MECFASWVPHESFSPFHLLLHTFKTQSRGHQSSLQLKCLALHLLPKPQDLDTGQHHDVNIGKIVRNNKLGRYSNSSPTDAAVALRQETYKGYCNLAVKLITNRGSAKLGGSYYKGTTVIVAPVIADTIAWQQSCDALGSLQVCLLCSKTRLALFVEEPMLEHQS